MESNNSETSECITYERECCEGSVHGYYKYYTEIFVPNENVIIRCLDEELELLLIIKSNEPQIVPVKIRSSPDYFGKVKNIRNIQIPNNIINYFIN